MEYIRTRCQPKDGQLHAIGHSMGGILLYALLSRCCEFSAELLFYFLYTSVDLFDRTCLHKNVHDLT